MDGNHKPTLWHIWISPYSEKVRWALRLKSVEHERRAPLPGIHMGVALRLTRGRQVTFPVLELDGKRIGDSTAIIAALEQRYPEPALYPDDPDERRRALELEDWFDEELVPYLRRLFFFELSRDRKRLDRFVSSLAPPRLARFQRTGAVSASTFTALRFGTAFRGPAEAARTKVLVALDRLETELGDSDYLVGDRFTVADLTAAASLHPLVLPPGGPITAEVAAEDHLRFRETLRDRSGFRWVESIYSRHRRPERVAEESVA
jgi:glutathione S-transferase